MESDELIRHALRIALEKKGANLRVLDVARALAITDMFVLITVQNRRQAQAICSGIDVEMKHAGVAKARIEGHDAGWWVLLDYETVVIHIFQAEAREFYDFDALWADMEDLTEEFLTGLPESVSDPSEG
ncbi:MAG: ribosome silencing factor [Planctomycetota bacterium]